MRRVTVAEKVSVPFFLLLILIVALALRLWHLTDPPWDYHNWRQTITLMVARDFARHGLPVFHPQVQWVSHNRPSDPSYFSAEFSIQSIVAAALYQLFGESDTLARVVVIAFSLAGIWFLYHLLYRRAGPLAAFLGAFIYALLPYHVFFGRVFMPEIPAVSLALGALDMLDRWTDDRKWSTLAVAAALASLAILQKLTVAFLFLPAAYLLAGKGGTDTSSATATGGFSVVSPRGKGCLSPLFRGLAWMPIPLFAISAIPPLAWYLHAAAMGRASGFAIMQPFRFGRDLHLWLQPAFLSQIGKALALEAFSPIGLALAVLGCLFWRVRGRAAWIFRLWLAGAAILLILTPSLLPANHYYLAVLLPAGAALAGMALADLTPNRKAYPLLAMVLILFAAGAIHYALPLYEPDRLPYNLGFELKRVTEPADLIVTETGGSPNILYYADRRGWMLSGIHDPAVIERLRQTGARYYANVFQADTQAHPEFFRELDARFKRVSAGEAPWRIYELAPRHFP